MLQVYVSHVLFFSDVCCKRVYLDVTYVSDICCKYFIWMLHMFVIIFQVFSCVSDVCFECLSYLYVCCNCFILMF
jgi:hypothetical protein